MATVLIDGGPKIGKGQLRYEQAFRNAIAEGHDVITGPRNGIWFSVSAQPDGTLRYWPHLGRPKGI